MVLAPSSSGPGRRPLKAVAPVRIRSGLPEHGSSNRPPPTGGGFSLPPLICSAPVFDLVHVAVGDVSAGRQGRCHEHSGRLGKVGPHVPLVHPQWSEDRLVELPPDRRGCSLYSA